MIGIVHAAPPQSQQVLPGAAVTWQKNLWLYAREFFCYSAPVG
jgi:hypothetical protein